MRYYGGQPVDLENAGAFSTLIAGSPSFDIGPRSPFKGMPQEELNKLKEWDQRPQDLQKYYERINAPGPKLPFALGLDANPLIAQAYPGPQAVGNAGALGGMMEAGPRFGPRPFNLDINAVDNRIESIGGSANIELDKNQRLQIGGTFNPAMTDPMSMAVPQGYEVYGAYQTPGVGINVKYRNTGNRGEMPGGFPGQINAGFQGRF